jgi:glycerate-2-kinase
MRDLLEEASQIFLETLRGVEVSSVINQKVRLEDDILRVGDGRLDLAGYREIIVIGLGKASLKMGSAVESVLRHRFTRGLLVTDRRDDIDVRSEVLIGGHPIPNSGSIAAAHSVIDLLASCGGDSLVVFLLSGGGSALVEMPVGPEISLEDLQELNRVLIKCGANIWEINIVRKHLSAVKGGRLGWLARRSPAVALFLSDVNSGDLQSIASNPLLPDEATLAQFYEVIERYQLRDLLPLAIKSMIAGHRVPELPKNGHWTEGPLVKLLLLQNSDAMACAADSARRHGFRVDIDGECAEGHYREVADSLIQKLLELHRRFPGEQVCLVSGGEVSCPVVGGGVGGRNQEFVLYSAARLAKLEGMLSAVVLSCGTDGTDGNSNAAGAVAHEGLSSAARARELEISPFIHGNDSHSFFKQAGGLIFTGPTGNNVRDLRIMLAQPLGRSG